MGHHHHHHSHDESNIGIAFFLNLAFTIIELIGGYMTNSVAIISDAIHVLGDSLSLGVAWFFQHVSKREESVNYTYGYSRFALIGAIINSVVLLIGSIIILTEAVPRIFAPQETNAKGMFIIAVIGIVLKGIAVLKTRKSSSMNEKVVSLHLLVDVLGWIAVLLGSVIIHFTGLSIIDPILSILISIFVIINVFRGVGQFAPILLQGTPKGVDYGHIKSIIAEVNGVEEVKDLRIWSLDENHNVLTANVILSSELETGEVLNLKDEIHNLLEGEGIEDSTIEFDIRKS